MQPRRRRPQVHPQFHPDRITHPRLLSVTVGVATQLLGAGGALAAGAVAG